MKWLRNWFKPKHRHDFDMTFPEQGGLSWLFVCKCGLATRSMEEASRLQGRRG